MCALIRSGLSTWTQWSSSLAFKQASKPEVAHWVQAGLDYLNGNPEMVKKSFLVCGITNSLDGSVNSMIHCANELPDIELPYTDESDDPFCEEESEDDEEEEPSEDDENNNSIIREYGSTLYVGMARKKNGRPYISIVNGKLKSLVIYTNKLKYT